MYKVLEEQVVYKCWALGDAADFCILLLQQQALRSLLHSPQLHIPNPSVWITVSEFHTSSPPSLHVLFHTCCNRHLALPGMILSQNPLQVVTGLFLTLNPLLVHAATLNACVFEIPCSRIALPGQPGTSASPLPGAGTFYFLLTVLLSQTPKAGPPFMSQICVTIS